MLIEDKVQIEAVKTRSYMMGEIDGKVMITQGRYIVFVKKEDFLLDIDKQKKLPEDGVKHFSTENIQSQMRAAVVKQNAYNWQKHSESNKRRDNRGIRLV